MKHNIPKIAQEPCVLAQETFANHGPWPTSLLGATEKTHAEKNAFKIKRTDITGNGNSKTEKAGVNAWTIQYFTCVNV